MMQELKAQGSPHTLTTPLCSMVPQTPGCGLCVCETLISVHLILAKARTCWAILVDPLWFASWISFNTTVCDRGDVHNRRTVNQQYLPRWKYWG